MNFSSDNVTCACTEIATALMAANDCSAMPYGADANTSAVEQTIADLFETKADVFLVATGTAANALALSVLAPPYGSIYCHPKAHITVDECGCPEFYTSGAKLVHLPDISGKITAASLADALKDEHGDVHHVKPAVVSLSQTSETGTVYTLDEIAAISSVAHEHGLKVHMDGARLANSVVALDCTPAQLTVKVGVDILSFGATKNGAFAAEAVVLFSPSLAEEFAYRRKRGGHLFSKMRFLAVQFEAYLKDDLWLKMAKHANDCMNVLAQGLGEISDVEILFPTDANMLFARLPNTMIEGLKNAGFAFYDWPEEERTIIRLVTAFNTEKADTKAFVTEARRLSNY
jgi:threonine aldolase